MSGNFDWQTEDDERREHSGWEEPAAPPAPPQRRPPWRLLGIIGALLLAVAALVWWRVTQRIEATTQAIRTDVIASHNLLQQAAADGDSEIFRAFLSGRDPAWTAGELAVFESGLFADRAPLGLLPVEGSLPVILPAPDEETDAAARPATITLSPDLNQAVVTVDQPYQRDDGGTVMLQQMTIYRRGEQRWLLAPPAGDFWGGWQTSEGDYVAVIYPQRDAEIGGRLADDLDQAVADMCASLPDIHCSADLYLSVRLDTEPQALATLAEPLGALRRARENESILELPTPSLVGLPAGDEAAQEAAYAALRDGYARHVLGAAIARAVAWECCQGTLLFSLLLDYQFSALGLGPAWPIGAADYQRVLDEQLTLARLNLLTYERLPEELGANRLWAARVAVDFLLHAGDFSAADLQRRLGRISNFGQYARRVLSDAGDGRPTPADPTQALWLYALQRAAEAEDETPLPDETLYLGCTAPGESEMPEASQLLRYDPATGGWTQLYSLQGFLWMTPLPGQQTMLLQQFLMASESWQTHFWRDGRMATAFLGDPGESAISLGQSDPTGRWLLLYRYPTAEGEIVRPELLDLETCDDTCAATPAVGQPLWSPDGEWVLYLGQGDLSRWPLSVVNVNGRYILVDGGEPATQQTLALGTGDDLGAAHPVGAGYAPFWIDERTFGYIRSVGGNTPASRAQEIVVATVDDPEPQRLLLSADLLQFLPDDSQLRRMTLAYVAPDPARPENLFIVAMDEVAEDAFVFLYDRTTGRAELRLTAAADFNHSLGFSPDGRYLALTGTNAVTYNPGSNLAPLWLHDIAANRTIPLLTRLPYFLPSVTYDWTPDGRLAVALDDNLVGVIAPDTGQVRLLGHGQGACTSVAWLDE